MVFVPEHLGLRMSYDLRSDHEGTQVSVETGKVFVKPSGVLVFLFAVRVSMDCLWSCIAIHPAELVEQVLFGWKQCKS